MVSSSQRPLGLRRYTETIVRSNALTIGALLVCAVPMLAFVTAELPPRAHLALSAALFAIAIVAGTMPRLRVVVMLISACVSARYIWYRVMHTLAWEVSADGLAAALLFVAELYAFVVLLCGYFQTMIVRRRSPVPLDAYDHLPLVDVYVPSYNEDLDLLRDTLVAARDMDYPHKEVYLLDDGRRPSARKLAESLGVKYLDRPNNHGAKAGNINAALPRTRGELIAFFDADHVPVRTFLTHTVGFFLEDPKCALVQTPHYFYNPDHFERNLQLEGVVPAEQKLFYHVLQPGNDFWNGSFFCGSCAVIRRSAMVGVGGMAEETLTEDAHTALKMHAAGWRSVYLDMPLAAGIATERLVFFVSQRIRWARGMAQVFRLDNPLLKPGLSLAQRITYFSASWHFLFGVPRMLFILAPPAYLLFGIHPMFADVREVLVFASPHLLLSWTGTAVANRNHRHSFWPEVFETVLATYTAIVTSAALVVPRTGVFKVTTKGATTDRTAYDWRRAAPTLVLLGICVASIVATVIRLESTPLDRATVMVAGVWNFYNALILAAAATAAWEPPQRRARHRVKRKYRMRVAAKIGETWTQWPGDSVDLSPIGMRLRVRTHDALPTEISVRLEGEPGATPWIRAEVLGAEPYERGQTVRVRLLDVTPAQHEGLVRFIYAPPDSWVRDAYVNDHPLRALLAVILTPVAAFLNQPGIMRWAVGDHRPKRALIETRGTARCIACDVPWRTGERVCDVCGHDPLDGVPAPSRARPMLMGWAGAIGLGALAIAYAPTANVPLLDDVLSLERWAGITYATRYEQLNAAYVDLTQLRDRLAGAMDENAPLPADWQKDLGRVRRSYRLGKLDFPDDAAARIAESEILAAMLYLEEGGTTYRRSGATSSARARLAAARESLGRASQMLGLPS